MGTDGLPAPRAPTCTKPERSFQSSQCQIQRFPLAAQRLGVATALTPLSALAPKFSPLRHSPEQCTGRCSCARTHNLVGSTPPPLVPALCALSRVGQPPRPSQCS